MSGGRGRAARACVALAFVLAAGASGPARAARDVPAFPLASCDGTPSDAEITVRGVLLLHDALRGQTPPADALRAAAALQLRYAFTVAQADAALPTLVPDGPPRAITLLAAQPVPYGRDLTLDWPADPQLRPESDYVKRALTRGRISPRDAATLFTYTARVRVALCEKAPGALKTLRLPAPRDPYLAYWLIPKQKRAELVSGTQRARTFPCADPEIAEYPHPEYLWYFFAPHKKAHGCPALLTHPRELTRLDVALTQRTPPSGLPPGLRRALTGPPATPLQAVYVFGYLNHQVPRPQPERLLACLQGHDPDAAACQTREWGTVQFLDFLAALPSALHVRERQVRTDPAGVAVTVHGTLRGSGRPLTLRAHLTETDFLGLLPPRHVPLLVRALGEADVLVYAGHSGLGLNFAVEKLSQGSPPGAVAAALAGARPRLLGFIGCYTYSYFGRDLARPLAQLRGLDETGGAVPDTLFAYTGSPVVYAADAALHTLSVLDCILGAPDPAATQCPPPARAGRRAPEFLIFDYARTARAAPGPGPGP